MIYVTGDTHGDIERFKSREMKSSAVVIRSLSAEISAFYGMIPAPNAML